MRTSISIDKFGWLRGLDYKKLIIAAFLFRFILASGYDIFVSVSGKDILLPDSPFYSTIGRYIALSLNGYSQDSLTKDMIPSYQFNLATFYDILINKKAYFGARLDEGIIYNYLLGIIYFIFGYFPLAVRAFNIFLSIVSTYLIFNIAKKQFGELIANIFLLIGLFLPTQVIYSVTLSRDFLRMFMVSAILWLIYGGVLWPRRQRA